MKTFYTLGSIILSIALVHVFFTLLTASSKLVESDVVQDLDFIDEEVKKHDIPNLKNVLDQFDNVQQKIQVLAVVASYYPSQLSALEWKDDDVVFTIGKQDLWFKEAKMLTASQRLRAQEYSRILYPYRTESLHDIFDELPKPRANFSASYKRSSAFQSALLGGTPSEIEAVVQDYIIFEKKVRLHPIAGAAVKRAERKIRQLAKTDAEVASFVSELKAISGYYNRTVRNSSNISMHAFGIAIDFIPHSFGGKAAYWQWARDQRPDTWDKLSLEERWLIPEPVVKIFQNHGFIWGGKWSHYDTIHFEYRPELIEYARLRSLLDEAAKAPVD